jgi:hypothetical protein
MNGSVALPHRTRTPGNTNRSPYLTLLLSGKGFSDGTVSAQQLLGRVSNNGAMSPV